MNSTNKLKRLTFFVLIYCILTDLNAQINIQYNYINEYQFNTKQALNFSAINSNPKSFEVYFVGKIKDSKSGLVADFKTQSVLLNPGINIFNPMNISFSELNYSNYDVLEIEEKSGTYPYGQYNICIFSICATSDCSGIGSSVGSMETPVCVTVNIENPTPLILTHPENESEIEETKPLYSWIPPSPVAGSSNLNYNMRLVEILEGQSKADALSMNRPLIEISGIERPTLMHPFDVPELEKGKWYAWQVEAFVGNTPIAKSEQWKFKVKKEEEKKDYRYFDLNNLTSDIPKVKIGDKLFFTIQNQLSNSQIEFDLKTLNGNNIKLNIERVVKDSIDTKQDIYSHELSNIGISKYLLTLNSPQFTANTVYELLIHYNNQKTIFRFEIIN